MSSTRTHLLALAAVLGACSTSGPQTGATRRVFSLDRATRSEPREALATSGLVFGPQWLPQVDAPVVHEEHEGTIFVTVGSVRATLEGDVVAVATDFPSARIVAAARDGARWLFVTEESGVFEAPSFLESLRAIPHEDANVTGTFRSRGALAWRDSFGRGWVTDGREVRRWPSESITHIAFASPRDGLAITAGGLVRWTTDGGRTDRFVALGPRAPRAAYGTSGQLELQASDGRFQLDARGDLRRASASGSTTLSSAQHEALLRSIYLRWPAALHVGAARQGRLEPRAVVAVNRTLLWFDTRDGRLARRSVDVMPTSACAAFAWGERALIHCARSVGQFVLDPSGRIAPFGDSFSDGIPVLFDDGATALSVNGCTSRDPNAGRNMLGPCLRRADGQWVSSPLLANALEYFGAHGSRVLIGRFDDDSILSLYDTRTATLEVLPAPDRTNAEPRSLVGASMASDGTPWSIDERESPSGSIERRIRLWTADTVVERTIPDESSTVGLVNRDVVVAVGRRSNELWISTDGGQHFDQRPLPAAGLAEPFDVAPNRELPAALACSARGCLVDSVAFVGWHRESSGRLVAAPNTAARATAAQTPATIAHLAIHCARMSTEHAAPAVFNGWTPTPWGRFRVESQPAARQTFSLSISWALDGSLDPSPDALPRRFSATNAALSLASVSDVTTIDASSGWRASVATERFAIFERCIDGLNQELCERFVARAGGSIERIETPEGAGRLITAIDGAAGTTAVLAGRGVSGHRAAWLFDDAGRVLAHKALPSFSQPMFTSALARRGARIGVIARDAPMDVTSFAFVPLFDGATLAPPASEPVRIGPWIDGVYCTGRATRDAWTIADEVDGLDAFAGFTAIGRALRPVKITSDVSPTGERCLRSFTWTLWFDESPEISRSAVTAPLQRVEALRVVSVPEGRGEARSTTADVAVFCAVSR